MKKADFVEAGVQNFQVSKFMLNLLCLDAFLGRPSYNHEFPGTPECAKSERISRPMHVQTATGSQKLIQFVEKQGSTHIDARNTATNTEITR